MAHIFHLTVDISFGSPEEVANFLTSEGLITNSNIQSGYSHDSRSVTVEVTVPNKDKFKRWLKRRDKNRKATDPRRLVISSVSKGLELGILGKGEKLVRRAREINYKRGQEKTKKHSP